MAINKVVNHSTMSHGAMRNCLEYVLKEEKLREHYKEIIGPYAPDKITPYEVYQTWLEEKKLWDKDNGRMYAHNIISFHGDEKVTPVEVLEIGKEFAEKFFPEVSAGNRTIILTILIAGAAAILFPVHEEKDK